MPVGQVQDVWGKVCNCTRTVKTQLSIKCAWTQLHKSWFYIRVNRCLFDVKWTRRNQDDILIYWILLNSLIYDVYLCKQICQSQSRSCWSCRLMTSEQSSWAGLVLSSGLLAKAFGATWCDALCCDWASGCSDVFCSSIGYTEFVVFFLLYPWQSDFNGHTNPRDGLNMKMMQGEMVPQWPLLNWRTKN